MRRPPIMEVSPVSTSERRDGGIQLTRRQLLATGAAGGLTLAALGPGSAIAFGATTPKRGGTLQVGLVGGSAATEQLDPNTSTVNSLDLARHQNVRGCDRGRRLIAHGP